MHDSTIVLQTLVSASIFFVWVVRYDNIIKEFQQKDTSKKHMNSKCKLVLNTLQQTVKVREEERDTHLKQV